MKRLTLVVVTTLTLVLAACGTESGPSSPGSPPDGSSGPGGPPQDTVGPPTAPQVIVDPEAEVVGLGILMHAEESGPVELCLGAVAESYPPQCGGPVLEGEFSWDEVEAETAGGVTWTNEGYYVTGHYDPSGSPDGTITLTRPVRADPPEGYPQPEAVDDSFPQLCEDPTADVRDSDPVADTSGPDGVEQENALQQLAQGTDGYAALWGSGGGVMNVVVTTDAEEARRQFREVYSGPLCVVQRDVPTEADARAAQDAVSAEFQELRLLSAGYAAVSGVLDVQVLLADETTVDRIHELVAPWLSPDEIVIHSALQPLEPAD
ncbi:hypothetical protein [Ornithinimicrobium cavernae]|uniref:hypothetical protein n=1 Tax=Ornithinimicrobium cavernae TaxID=2666047 RepID=UPI000D6912FB|nr:hypothetical protein [Ornithinimicrobium cavernae]